MIHPTAQNYTHRFRHLLKTLVKQRLLHHLDKTLRSLSRKQLRVEPHHPQQLVTLLIHRNIHVEMLSYRLNNLLLTYVIQPNENSTMLILVKQLLNKIDDHPFGLLFGRKLKLPLQKGIIHIQHIDLLRATLEVRVIQLRRV